MNINKLLFILTTIFLLANNSIAETTPGLRISEKEFLEKMQNKKQESEPNKKGNKNYQYIKEDETEHSQCQTALTKIDKFTIEINELKMQTVVDTKNLNLKIKSLESQIERYKIQAKQFCPKELLNQSIHMKSH
jgi:hypothetical protein